jgi:hypothetical protein
MTKEDEHILLPKKKIEEILKERNFRLWILAYCMMVI